MPFRAALPATLRTSNWPAGATRNVQLQGAAGILGVIAQDVDWLGVSSQDASVDGDIAGAKRLRVIHQQRTQIDDGAAAVGVLAAQNRCSGAVLNHVARSADHRAKGDGVRTGKDQRAIVHQIPDAATGV